MKKYLCICFFVVNCIAVLLFVACGNKKDEKDHKDTFSNEYTMDDMKTLEDNLTKEYDLDELRSFFKDSNANDRIGYGSSTPILKFSEVNNRFPVEILRTGDYSDDYSVYKVSQGGYFYVFWMKSFTTDTSRSDSELSVYFSAYLASDISPSLFDSLTPGISTAEDVQKIDPSFELSFLISHGVFSYSYINDETVLQIEYTHPENIDGYDDLIVKEMKIVARDSVPSRYSTLLSSDLP